MPANAQEPPFDPAAILIDPEVPEGPRQSLAYLARRVPDAAQQYPLRPQTYQARVQSTTQPEAALIGSRIPWKSRLGDRNDRLLRPLPGPCRAKI